MLRDCKLLAGKCPMVQHNHSNLWLHNNDKYDHYLHPTAVINGSPAVLPVFENQSHWHAYTHFIFRWQLGWLIGTTTLSLLRHTLIHYFSFHNFLPMAFTPDSLDFKPSIKGSYSKLIPWNCLLRLREALPRVENIFQM